jgi:hypothetical protein
MLALLKPDETALDLFKRGGRPSRSHLSTGWPTFDVTEPNGYRVLEVNGDAASGKTGALLALAAHCARPRALGGLESTCVYFDLDKKLSVPRLKAALNHAASEERVFVLRPSGAKELLAQLDQLPRQVRLVVLDGLLSLSWANAFTEPLAAGYSVDVPLSLFRQERELGFAVAASKPSARAEFCSKTWTGGVTHRMHLDGRGNARLTRMEDSFRGEHDVCEFALAG